MLVFLIALLAWVLFTAWAIIEIKLKAAWWRYGAVAHSEHPVTYWCFVSAKFVLGAAISFFLLGANPVVEGIGIALVVLGISQILIGAVVWLSKVRKAAKQVKEGMPTLEEDLLHLTKEQFTQATKTGNDTT
jgi:hypothetical protein